LDQCPSSTDKARNYDGKSFGAVMDAREFFENVVVPRYTEFVRRPTDFPVFWTALVSMNTVPEYLALHRRGYPLDVSRNELRREAQEIRGQLSGLEDLQFCADTFKHVRKSGFGLQASSTDIDLNDPTTWKIGEYDLVQVAHDAFATLSSLSELKATP
jgi:hypothetical protein